MQFKISTGNSRMDKTWKQNTTTWEAFAERLSRTTVTSETQAEYKKMKKPDQDNFKDIGGFVAGELRDGRRRKSDVISRSMLTLDMDYADDSDDISGNIELFYEYKAILYSTHKHTKSKPRLRLIIPLSRSVTADEYQAIARMIAKQIGIEFFDDTTYETNRLMYWPSTSADGEYYFKEIKGKLLDPDSILKLYKNWRDTSTWPVSSRQTKIINRLIKKHTDPTKKEGLIGAFCRSYVISDAIDTFLKETYLPSILPERYDYLPADSTAGLIIYENKYAYSHHATDPACGKLLNAFDLVRIHLYGELDEKSREDTVMNRLPSYKAMADMASKDEKVKLILIKERQVQAKEDFYIDEETLSGNEENLNNREEISVEDTEWQKKLEYESRSPILKNNLRNITLILQNDPKLKGIVFNQQLDGMEIKGSVPWNHPSKYWRDADDAQLISYVDLNYGTFSQRNYQISVAKVTDDRSYHPIREYLESLPKWDEVPRVDTLLVDYLGAVDNEYIRAVTRKTLCAAIIRVLNPGCKFDTMIVLNGPQGVGKSTLISKLAGEWFSDSLNLSDTKDKTAAEKLQGYWILEISELAGLRKAEVDTLRSFLSRQNDIYRAAFGRHATPHPRQCIFFGTTNAESGYLRDTTGNRRFWPVKTPGGSKQSWELSDETIQQIWAETLAYAKAGEVLYLEPWMEEFAKQEQREALESDEREGLIRDYLDTLLPDDWDQMDLFERRNFINGSDFGSIGRTGTIKRRSVCNMEIWCECLGKERSNIKRADSNELSAILNKIGWERLPKKERVKLYGPQYLSVPKE